MEVYIEVSKGSNIKYEYDKITNLLKVDRILHNTNTFPFNYGFIPNTIAPDGDPLDVIVISDYSFVPGCIVTCKILGGIQIEDEGGKDDKIICVLDDNYDPKSKKYQEIMDINEEELKNIIYFLNHYKDGETDKFMKVGDVYNKETALTFIEDCCK